MERNTWNLLAGRNQDVSVGICRRIVRRRQQAGELVGGIHQGVVGIKEILLGLVVDAGFHTLPARGGDVLEHAPALENARNLDDVAFAVGTEQPKLPVASTAGIVEVSA